MNFLTLHVDGKGKLVNMDNVTEVHDHIKSGSSLYFNAMATDEEQSYIHVDENIVDLQNLIKELKASNK